MIDIHSHIVFGVDDGSESLEETLKMLEEAKNAGVETVFATPHFMDHVLNPDKTFDNFRVVLNKASELGVDIKLGFEVVLHPLLLRGIEIAKRHTMNKTEYILVEFPFNSSFEFSKRVLAQIRQKGLIPIVAHPERIETFIKKRGLIRELKESGCLIQVNAGSITGYYGEKARLIARKIVEEKTADFIASDAHKTGYYNRYLESYHIITGWTDEDYAQRLFKINARKLIGI
ncbi:MAG TPA: hypothetical protein GXX37_10180 [Clostridiaceae bacterium]|nr:hypothetical protein [Clostridiaceae bacterium]